MTMFCIIAHVLVLLYIIVFPSCIGYQGIILMHSKLACHALTLVECGWIGLPTWVSRTT